MVTGTPGVGKTAVSRRLATLLGALHVDLADLVKREKLTSGYDEPRQTLIADTDRLAKRLQQVVKHHEGIVIVDGHYATSVVPRDQVTKVFVLRRHPRQLREQMEKRGFTGEKLWENLASEILDVCLYDAINDVGDEKVCEVDTTDKSVDETGDEILSLYNGKQRCTVGITDWLGKLEEEKILDEYLKWSL